MKIRNFCLTLSTKRIKQYLSVLPPIYRTCEVPIVVLSNNYFGYLIFLFYSWKYSLPNKCYSEFRRHLGTAWYDVRSHDSILVHVIYKSQYSLPDVLFHELRHWYQTKYMKQFHINSGDYSDGLSSKEYDSIPLEKDANTFAKKYCKKLGIKYATISGVSWIMKNRCKLKF